MSRNQASQVRLASPPAVQLAARPIEKMIEDEKPVIVPVPLMTPGAEQREHGLAGSGATDDEMLPPFLLPTSGAACNQALPFLRQRASRFLLLAEVLDAGKLELALGHQPGASA